MPDNSKKLGPKKTAAIEARSKIFGEDFLAYLAECQGKGINETRQVVFEAWVHQKLGGLQQIIVDLAGEIEDLRKKSAR